MKTELQKKLFKKYPKIFRQKGLDMSQTCMCWGIECPDTWYYIIDQLCYMLQFNTKHNGFPQVEATQVKEKYGSLRFYYTTIGGNKEYIERHLGYIDGLVSFAESLTYTICASCGSKENVKATSGWITYLCDKCRNKKECVWT